MAPCPNSALLLSQLDLLQPTHTLWGSPLLRTRPPVTPILPPNSVPVLCLEHCHMPDIIPSLPPTHLEGTHTRGWEYLHFKTWRREESVPCPV